jgi:antitoxin (DNA-binding transcriptional repressor) of toxin-antitoxin stability system
MIGGMGTGHITEAELARDLHDILAKVQQGVEVVVEQDHRPVAVLGPLKRNPPSWDRLRLLQFLEESGPGWNLEEHPELNEGAAQWVESLRRLLDMNLDEEGRLKLVRSIEAGRDLLDKVRLSAVL